MYEEQCGAPALFFHRIQIRKRILSKKVVYVEIPLFGEDQWSKKWHNF